MSDSKESNPGGRPSDYPEKIELAKGYLDSYKTEVPSVAGLALHMGVARSTVYAWAENKEYSEFSYIVEQVLANQEVKLTDGGLKGDYNASVTKLMLSKHGYAEKVQSEVSGPNGKPVETTTTTWNLTGVRPADQGKEDSET
ncbi:terminase small subunit [Agarilytica rhodophyticola]|uniref:terminase small subunit n=1 Tax=Agarilytica rhodophyticola TaxID=1737490 RepID=UPI000B345ACE|nr:terminase small subunit [Agarilytica rhodophyticola]